jgi:hypothetical protein
MFKMEAARACLKSRPKRPARPPSASAARPARPPISGADLGADFRHDHVETRNRHQSCPFSSARAERPRLRSMTARSPIKFTQAKPVR